MPETNGLLITGGLVYDHDGDVHRPAQADVLIEGEEIVRIEAGLADRLAGEGTVPRVIDARDKWRADFGCRREYFLFSDTTVTI